MKRTSISKYSLKIALYFKVKKVLIIDYSITILFFYIFKYYLGNKIKFRKFINIKIIIIDLKYILKIYIDISYILIKYYYLENIKILLR